MNKNSFRAFRRIFVQVTAYIHYDAVRTMYFIILIPIAVDKNGDVCISILHEPGDDKFGYEKASERWLPVHTVETILISVISMLADPNDESPANVDAAVSSLILIISFFFKLIFSLQL